jgi:hypothetical protein
MKPVLYLFCFLILFSCDNRSHTTKEFIPGIYVRKVKNEFSIGHDTLFITAVNNGTYSLDYNASYQRIKDGKLMAVENKREKWLANYDATKDVLVETRLGKILFFQQDSNLLYVGRSPYQRISN